MMAWTDYPLPGLDVPRQRAPIRRVKVLAYDGDKYCRIQYGATVYEVKRGYLYSQYGRCGEVPCVDVTAMEGDDDAAR